MVELQTMRRSPLAGLDDEMAAATEATAGAVSVREVPFIGMVGLRVGPDSPAGGRLSDVLGVRIPSSCGTTTTNGTHTVLWLGPDEQLVVTTDDAAELARRLAESLEADPGQAVDLSANRTVVELSGPRARRVLEKGCPVDLHPRAFAPGTAVTTTLARVPVLLWQTDEESYRLLPRSSFADYVARWLVDAMTEFADVSAARRA